MKVSFPILLFLGFTAAAGAGTLPGPVTVAECTVGAPPIDDPTLCATSGNDATATGFLTLLPFVGLSAHVTSGPINTLFNPGAGVIVSVTYSFQVLGGNPGDIVPILVATNLQADASSTSHALGFAETVIHTSFGNTFKAVCTNGSCGTTDQTFSGTFGWSAMSGESGDTIQLEIEASSGDSLLSEFADASADPFVFIDPSFSGAANYSIEVSDGVANAIPAAAGAPEPGTFALLGIALSVVALCHRSTHSNSSHRGTIHE